MKTIIESHIPYIKGALEPFGEVVYLEPEQFTPEAVADADALVVRTRTRCDAALLDGSNVKFVGTATIAPTTSTSTTALREESRWQARRGVMLPRWHNMCWLMWDDASPLSVSLQAIAPLALWGLGTSGELLSAGLPL